MEGIDVIMVIAIILFARLGIRLLARYIKMRKETKNDNDAQDIS